MPSIAAYLESSGRIARRQDLLRAGFTDGTIRFALARRQIFRVRHGWYALIGTPDVVARTIRIGGRLTGLAALRLRKGFLPPPDFIDIAVPRTASGLRSPHDRRERLAPESGIRLHWVDSPRRDRHPSDWLASEDEALLCVLRNESRDVAVSCCDAALRYLEWTPARLDAVFALAPCRVQSWRRDVHAESQAWGETVVRLMCRDAGIPFEPQAFIHGIGHYDGRISPRVLVEIDGKQHDEGWGGSFPSSFEDDHSRDLKLALTGQRSIRISYRQIRSERAFVLAALRRARADDLAAIARERRAAAQQKLRRLARERRKERSNNPIRGETPQFS
jgi:very-short-patch-repair endonuclease